MWICVVQRTLTFCIFSAFSVRLFSVLRYEVMIHEFDPYFNYRTTKFLADEGFYQFHNWFDDRAWYPLGRIIGGTIYPGLMVTSAVFYHILNFLHISIEVRNVCVFLAPFFSSLTTLVTYLLTSELYSKGAGTYEKCLRFVWWLNYYEETFWRKFQVLWPLAWFQLSLVTYPDQLLDRTTTRALPYFACFSHTTYGSKVSRLVKFTGLPSVPWLTFTWCRLGVVTFFSSIWSQCTFLPSLSAEDSLIGITLLIRLCTALELYLVCRFRLWDSSPFRLQSTCS